MNFEDVNVHHIAQEVCQLINVQLRLKDSVFLLQSVSQDVPQTIQSDYQRLKQILINLMRNSTKFTFKGYIQLRVRRAKLKLSKAGIKLGTVDAV